MNYRIIFSMKFLFLFAVQSIAFVCFTSCRVYILESRVPTKTPQTPPPDAPIVSDTYKYVVNNAFSTVTRCLINPDNTLTGANCIVVANSDPIFDGISGISIYENYGYVTNLFSNSIAVCHIGPNGVWDPCQDAGVSFLNQPSFIFFTNSTAIYITNSGSNDITFCTNILPNGVLNNCTVTSSTFNNPSGITISGSRAYITNYGNNTVSKCSVSITGDLASCTSVANSSFINPQGVAVYGNYVYITNYNGTVSICSSDLNTCGTSSFSFGEPLQHIKIDNTSAYITSLFSGIVELCSINSETGQFDSCNQTPPSYDFRFDIIGIF